MYCLAREMPDSSRISQKLTSQVTALLQVIVAVLNVAFAQFLSNKSGHHGADPLLTDNGIFGSLEGLGIVKVDTVECGRDRRLLSLE